MFVLEAKDSKPCTRKNIFYLSHRSDFGSKKSINWSYILTADPFLKIPLL